MIIPPYLTKTFLQSNKSKLPILRKPPEGFFKHFSEFFDHIYKSIVQIYNEAEV